MQDKIKVGIITQEDPFFLAEAIDYFFSRLPKDQIEIVVAVVFPGSPFGKQLSFMGKALHCISVFGLSFFIHYGVRFVLCKLDARKSVKKTIMRMQVPVIDDIHKLNTDKSVAKIMHYKPNVLVSIGGNQIFGHKVIQAPRKGILNLHTALLPRYRGLMPTFWVLKNDEKETGVSVFQVDKGIDTGDILVQKKIAIHGQSQAELIRATKLLGMDAMIEAILAIKADSVTLIPNPDELSTYFHFPTRRDVKAFYRKGKKFF